MLPGDDLFVIGKGTATAKPTNLDPLSFGIKLPFPVDNMTIIYTIFIRKNCFGIKPFGLFVIDAHE